MNGLTFFTFLLLLGSLNFLPGLAHADDNGILDANTTEVIAPSEGAKPAESYPAKPSVQQDEETAPSKSQSSLPAVSPRFNLGDDERFLSWMMQLCREAPMEKEIAPKEIGTAEPLQKRFSKVGVTTRKANNKLGSLVLFLENYVENIRQRSRLDSTTNRPVGRSPATNDLLWLGSGDWKFPTKLATSNEYTANLKRYSSLFKAGFYPLRELSDLGGKPESLESARKILKAIEAGSPCQTRALVEKFSPAPKLKRR